MKISPNIIKVSVLTLCMAFLFIGQTIIGKLFAKDNNLFIVNQSSMDNITYDETNITVNGCKLSAYVASDLIQKAKGMLGFTDATFKNDSMIFLGEEFRTHYYHTMGMEIDIMIMGLKKETNGAYSVVGTPHVSPPGIENIKIQGEAVLEIPTKRYEAGLKACLKLDGKAK